MPDVTQPCLVHPNQRSPLCRLCGLNWTQMAQKSDAHRSGMMDTDTEIIVNVREGFQNECEVPTIEDL